MNGETPLGAYPVLYSNRFSNLSLHMKTMRNIECVLVDSERYFQKEEVFSYHVRGDTYQTE